MISALFCVLPLFQLKSSCKGEAERASLRSGLETTWLHLAGESTTLKSRKSWTALKRSQFPTKSISIGGIITRGTSLQESLRQIIEDFAVSRSLESVNDLGEYYNPTMRQRRLIENAEARDKSFAKGWARVFVSDKFGEAITLAKAQGPG